jgi:cis-3-alkyl-4-acyloxetan-2-one decarboxylase
MCANHLMQDLCRINFMAQVDWRTCYPFRSHYAAISGHKYHFLDEGSGEPLLFVHGNPTWSFYWRNLIRGLREKHRCIAVDHIGCGLSDKPADATYTLAQHTANLCEFIEQHDLQNITLLVHDWGGAIGLGAATMLHERFRRIVLFNTGAFPPPFVPWRIAACRLPFVGKVAIRGLNLFARAALSMAVEHPERMTPEVQAGLLAPYDSWAHRVAIWNFVRDIPFTEVHPTHAVLAKLERSLPSLAQLPITMIWGMRDWCFRPECLTRFQAIFPQAEVHAFHDAGHYVVEDAHERIVPIVAEFIRRHPV